MRQQAALWQTFYNDDARDNGHAHRRRARLALHGYHPFPGDHHWLGRHVCYRDGAQRQPLVCSTGNSYGDNNAANGLSGRNVHPFRHRGACVKKDSSQDYNGGTKARSMTIPKMLGRFI